MANWLLCFNINDFDLVKAYDSLPYVYWENDPKTKKAGLKVDDIVYFYATGDVGQVMFAFKVYRQTDSIDYPNDHDSFWLNKSQKPKSKSRYAILEKIAKADQKNENLSRTFLIKKNLIDKSSIAGVLSDKSDHLKKRYQELFNYLELEFKNTDYPDEADTSNSLFPEGGKKQVLVNSYERSPDARAKCIEIFKARCTVCNMSFGETYGEFAEGFIHVHHIKKLSEIKEEYKVDAENDLRPVCPNCHAMLHRKLDDGSFLSIEELRKVFVEKNSNK